MKFYVKKDNLKYFEDYLNSIVQCVDWCECKIVTYVHANQTFDRDGIFVQVVPKSVRHPAILLNTEQLTRNIHKHSPRVRMWIDYSTSNLNLLQRKHKMYLPYPYNPVEAWDEVPTYDVAMVGQMSPKRMTIFNLLKDNNISCIHVKGWGSKRDNIIAKSRVLLNIHHSREYNIFETLRCDRWIMSQHVVVSENSEITGDPLHNHVIFVPYKNIVRKVKQVIANFEETKEKLYEGFDLESIQTSRREQISKIYKFVNGSH